MCVSGGRASSENWESLSVWDESASLELSETDQSSSPAVVSPSRRPAGNASESPGATGTYEGVSGLCQVVVTNRTELPSPTGEEANDWDRIRSLQGCAEKVVEWVPVSFSSSSPGPPAGHLCALPSFFHSLRCLQC